MLATRPVLFHLTKLQLEGGGISTENISIPGISTLQKIAATCVEAAGMTLDVLRSLRQQALLGDYINSRFLLFLLTK